MNLDLLILSLLAILGIADAWRGRLEIMRERQEVFERIKRGRMAF